MWQALSSISYQVFYRPVFNLFFIGYNALSSNANIGVVTIFFATCLKLLLLPLALSENFNGTQRLEIDKATQEIEKRYADNPLKKKELERRIIKENRTSIVASFVSIFIQTIFFVILLILYREGLGKAGLPDLYDSIPEPEHLNQIWLGIDLLKPHFWLAVIACLLIFLERTWAMMSSPFLSASDKIFQYVIPFGAFFILNKLPAGISLYLLTFTLCSLCIITVREIVNWLIVTFETQTDQNSTDEDEKAS